VNARHVRDLLDRIILLMSWVGLEAALLDGDVD
jgi:hypothetical protein